MAENSQLTFLVVLTMHVFYIQCTSLHLCFCLFVIIPSFLICKSIKPLQPFPLFLNSDKTSKCQKQMISMTEKLQTEAKAQTAHPLTTQHLQNV